MPKYYQLDENEKNVVYKMREGIKHLTLEDYETIESKAYVMHANWSKRPRGQVIMPQDGVNYWIAVATHEYILEQLGIKLD